MKIFISWSGEPSLSLAITLRDWLPSVIQAVTPYVSAEDIDKGARWLTDISRELEEAEYGILCVTAQNLAAPWLNFEAGALSKSLGTSKVVPFLFGVDRGAVTGPLLQFQSTIAEKEDIRKLMRSLNKFCGSSGIDENRLDETFNVWWPQLASKLEEIEREAVARGEQHLTTTGRDVGEILEELVELTRASAADIKVLAEAPARVNVIAETVQMTRSGLDGWWRVLERLNPKIRAYFREALPTVVDNNRLVLEFPYSFHHKRATENLNDVMPLVREWLGSDAQLVMRLKT